MTAAIAAAIAASVPTARSRQPAMRAAAALLAAALLAGCGQTPLYTRLSEKQANEIVAVLMTARIDAGKAMADDGSWQVQIDKADLPRAIEVLHNVGYPRETFQTLGEVFKKEGFVSSPIEERARWIHARQQELEQTLYTTIDGVIAARVHLAIPERDPLSEKTRPSSAAVVIKHEADANFANQIASIKAIVINSVEGLPYENVTVSLFPARSWPVEVLAPPPPANAWLTGTRPAWLAAALALLLAASTLAAWRLGWLQRLRGARAGASAGPVTSPAVGADAAGVPLVKPGEAA